MQKLKMHSPDMTQDNIARIRELFPNCVTEAHDAKGQITLKVDFDLLRQELSGELVEGPQERYRLDWPGKRQAMLTANAPINKSLRPCREESVDFDTTENLYIEGDNLEVLKLLQESYLGKVKMIYIDPPYNTGNDFIYKDDFAEEAGEFLRRDGQYNDDGKRIVQNMESNGRFHSDWLNMVYQRLRVAKNLLTDDGIIFISIDDNEVIQLRKICDEIFGSANFRNQIIVRRGAKSVQAQFNTWDKLGQDIEYIVFYSKNECYRFPQQRKRLDEKKCGTWNNHWRGTNRPTMRYPLFGITPETGQWRWSHERSITAIENYKKMLSDLCATAYTITQDQIDRYYIDMNEDIDFLRLSTSGKPEHYIAPTDSTLLNNSWNDLLVGSSSELLTLFDIKVFDTAKLTTVIERMLNFCATDSIILDFFSGSATTAHAVMQLNAEDGGKRKFIMVQLPEICPPDSEAAKANYKNICEIGKERIRRAGKKIKEENPLTTQDLDIGFRVLKVKPSCMADVYYTPDTTKQQALSLFDNIKTDATPEDLLFQVLTDWGVELHLPIVPKTIKDKKVFFVDENSLAACFDSGINEDFTKELAAYKPLRVVFRDAGFANDAARINAEQIFKQLSPDTEVRVL